MKNNILLIFVAFSFFGYRQKAPHNGDAGFELVQKLNRPTSGDALSARVEILEQNGFKSEPHRNINDPIFKDYKDYLYQYLR